MRNHEVADAVIGQRVRHAAESRRPRRRPDQILQDQVPADEERHALAHGHVAVRVGRTRGLRDPHAKLCVAHTCGAERETNTHAHSHTALSSQGKAELEVLIGALS